MENLNKIHSIGLVVNPSKIEMLIAELKSSISPVAHYIIDLHKYYKCKPFYTVTVYSYSATFNKLIYDEFDKRAS